MNIISDQNHEKINLKALAILEDSVGNILKVQEYITLGISGGSGVIGLFKLLAQDSKIPWNRVHIFMVDERFVPTDHQDSNFLLAKGQFIDNLIQIGILPEENVHPFLYDPTLSDFGVTAYCQKLNLVGGKLDIVVMGMGEDGHVASLFPNHDSIKNEFEQFIVVKDSPKPPPSRVSASIKLLQKAQTSMLIFFGPKKQNAFSMLQDDCVSIRDCPSKVVTNISNSYIFTDLSIE